MKKPKTSRYTYLDIWIQIYLNRYIWRIGVKLNWTHQPNARQLWYLRTLDLKKFQVMYYDVDGWGETVKKTIQTLSLTHNFLFSHRATYNLCNLGVELLFTSLPHDLPIFDMKIVYACYNEDNYPVCQATAVQNCTQEPGICYV